MPAGIIGAGQEYLHRAETGLQEVAQLQQNKAAEDDAQKAAHQQNIASGVGLGASIGGAAGGPIGLVAGAVIGGVAGSLF